ncbi:MAG: diguanylate phosphodiesterase [Aquificaceae bacterium]|nr:diguanylate phosphodiesterase [Aquificaceae bacterium]
MKKAGKSLRVYATLEHVVKLPDGSLYGYLLTTRILSGNVEIGYGEITDKNIKENAEFMAIKHIVNKHTNKKIFIRMPQESGMKYLQTAPNPNVVICLPIDMRLENMAKIVALVKKLGMKCAICDYSTIGYELKEFKLGSFDYIFLRDDFYTNAKRSELKKLIDTMKFLKITVGFRNIDSTDKLKLALSMDADIGHGYLFGSEMVPVGILEE